MRVRRLASVPLLIALGMLMAAEGLADEGRMPTQGALMARGDGEKLLDFPLQHTDVAAEVSGAVSRVTVRQVFENPFREAVEAIYVFPLPQDAAVTDMVIEVGGRRIRGLVKPRDEAKAIYEKAKAEGKTAGLLEQERPNLFTQSLANILPGEKITVEIRYVERLRHAGNTYRFVFPMVVGPRFVPDGVPDRDRITPPPLKPGERTGHDISLAVDIAAGLPLRALRSESHEVTIAEHEDGGAEVRISPKDAIPNKDFLLTWTLAGEEPEAAVLTHRADRGGYFTLRVEPPADVQPDEIRPRELVFVVDCSGSMRGPPIEAAKSVIRRCLTEMNAGDTFRILKFSQSASSFSPFPLPNTPDTVRRALKYVDLMAGSGGTRMLAGVQAALAGDPGDGRMRIVFFLTDGFIGNENRVLDAVEKELRDARIFPLGVGSSVNRYLIEELALAGRGVARFIRHDAKPEKIEEEVGAFYDRVARPLLTDLEIDWNGLPVADLYPREIHDLFAGQPVELVGRYTGGAASAEVTLRGRLGRAPWERTIPVALPEVEERNDVLPVLWARARITDLMRKLHAGPDETVKQEVTNLAVEFHLMSAFTAFIAVDERVVVSPGGERKTVHQPLPIPEGTEFGGFFGDPETQGGPPKRRSRGRGGGGGRGGTRGPPPPSSPVPSPGGRPSGGDSGSGGAAADGATEKGVSPTRRLIALQKDDGSFRESGFGPVGSTALFALALTGYEVTPTESEEGKALARALVHLEKSLAKPDLARLDRALAVLALSEAHTWSGNAHLRGVVVKTLPTLLAGGESWDPDAALLTMAAFKSAARAGIPIPEKALERCAALVTRGTFEGHHAVLLTMLLGKKVDDKPRLKPVLEMPDRPLFWFLTVAAARAMGGEKQREWAELARKEYLAKAKQPSAIAELTRGVSAGWFRVVFVDW